MSYKGIHHGWNGYGLRNSWGGVEIWQPRRQRVRFHVGPPALYNEFWGR